MRFGLRVDVWMEVDSLEDAQAAMGRVELAAHEALGSAGIDDPASGARWRAKLEPADDAAAAGVAADDLGPGIVSVARGNRPAEPEVQ